jgi:hypothetical protein
LRRLWCVALGASLTATACKIERTPQEYIDHRSPVQQVRMAASEELSAMITRFEQLLAAGDLEAGLDTLGFAPDGMLVTSDPAPAEGDNTIREAMRRRIEGAGPLRPGGSRVAVGPRGGTAWFLVSLSDSSDAPLQLTGTLVRGERGWEIVQAHLSEPVAPASTASAVPPLRPR